MNGNLFQNHQKIHNLTIVAALLVAGIWAIIEFWLTTQPSIVVSTKCESVRLPDERTFLRVHATIENLGTAKKEYENDAILYISIRNIIPDSEVIEDTVVGYIDFAKAADGGVFEFLGAGTESLERNSVIRPKEKKPFSFVYLLPPWVSDISVYASVRKNGDDSEQPEFLEKGYYNTCSLKPGVDVAMSAGEYVDYKDYMFEYVNKDEYCQTRPFDGNENQQQQQQQQQQYTNQQGLRSSEHIAELRQKLGIALCQN